MVNDPVADLFTRIRNAQVARHMSTRISQSRMAERVLAVLQSEGFIEAFHKKSPEGKVHGYIEVWLRYFENGQPMISSARRVSSSGRRVYKRCQDLPKIARGLGISLVSTSEGVMSDREARRRKIGGEVLAIVR